ncbi:MAG TPA: cytochrome c3 family protein [Anaeromyxobacteraceae bacterium]|nr:cytochrome c3 family protein [Anaeromyxobacteraceae bacterium]
MMNHRGSALCAAVAAALAIGCAAPAAAERRSQSGPATSFRTAHRTARATPPASAVRRAAVLDPACQLGAAPRSLTPSTECLGCHDGTEAAVRGSSSHHPFASDYEAARLRGVPLRPFQDVPAQIVLVGGQVACTSCHAAASPEAAHVALSMGGSGLCLGCHPR